MPERPTGTVTFLFTDIQGSAKLWEQYPEAMRDALARHDALVRHAIESHGGYVFKTMGDSFCSAFTTAPDALAAALSAQRALQSGVMEYRSDGVVGQHSNTPTLHSIARTHGAAHGRC